jgi:hypothetical protein
MSTWILFLTLYNFSSDQPYGLGSTVAIVMPSEAACVRARDHHAAISFVTDKETGDRQPAIDISEWISGNCKLVDKEEWNDLFPQSPPENVI